MWALLPTIPTAKGITYTPKDLLVFMQEPAKNLTVYLTFFYFLRIIYIISKIGYLKNKNWQSQLQPFGITRIKGLGPRVWCKFTTPAQQLVVYTSKISSYNMCTWVEPCIKKKKSQRDKMDRRENRNLLTEWNKMSHTYSQEGSGAECDDWLMLAFSTDFNKAHPFYRFQQSYPSSHAIMLVFFVFWKQQTRFAPKKMHSSIWWDFQHSGF